MTASNIHFFRFHPAWTPPIAFLTAALFSPCLAGADNRGEDVDSVPVADTGGTFEVLDAEFDYGVLRADDVETVTHTFRFRNSGGGNLLITEIIPSCECATSIVSASDLAPGQSATLTAAMNLHGKTGVSGASIEVRSNDPENPARTFVITGTVLNLWRVVPTQLDMGDLGKGESKERILKVLSEYFEGETPHRITGVRSDDPAVQGAIGAVRTPEAEPGQKFFVVERPVNVRVTAGEQVGPQSARLYLSTDDPRGVTQVVEVKWIVEGDLKVSAKRVIVLKRGDTTRPINIAVESRSGMPFEILSIVSVARTGNRKDLVFTPLNANSPTKKTYKIELSESVKPGKPNLGEIVITTNHPEQKEISVPYTASSIAPRTITTR